MDRDFIKTLNFVCPAGTLDGIHRQRHICSFLATAIGKQWSSLPSRRVLDVKQEIGTNTIHPTRINELVRNGLIFENNCGYVHGGRIKLGTARDRIVSGLQTRDR
jgi:hypothetical protein